MKKMKNKTKTNYRGIVSGRPPRVRGGGYGRTSSHLRRQRRSRKRFRSYQRFKEKIAPLRYADFAFEVHLSTQYSHDEALTMVKSTFGRYKINREKSSSYRHKSDRCRIYLVSETDLLLLRMASPEVIYKVYRLIDPRTVSSDDSI